MQIPKEPRPSDIFDEIARGTKLDQTLHLIALKATLDLKAPTAKIWVVKHGDICDRCPLAEVCANRQMCLHLVTVVGAEMENEYPRIPLSILNTALIARGGVAEFKETDATGEKLFGIQQQDFANRPCSYALYPLKGISGTVGVIGVFNDRLIEAEEVQILAQLAPAAVAAIRVAELQSRCDSLRHQLEKELAEASIRAAAAPPETLSEAANELQAKLETLEATHQQLLRLKEKADRHSRELESDNARLRETNARHEDDKQRFRAVVESLEQQVSELSRENNDLQTTLQSRERQIAELESEIAAYQAKGEIPSAILAITESNETANREPSQPQQAVAMRAESDNAEWKRATRQLEEKIALLEATNAELRDNYAALSENLEDATSSLRVAEESRARLELERLKLQEEIEDATKERERLLGFQNQMRQETDNLISENEQLRGKLASHEVAAETADRAAALQEQLQATEQRVQEVEQENAQLKAEQAALRQQTSQLEEVAMTFKQHHANLEEEAATFKEQVAAHQQETERLRQMNAELQGENTVLQGANAQMQEAMKRLEEIMPRLEETTTNLRERVERSERLCTELEQHNRDLVEKNHHLNSERQGQAELLATISHEIRTLLHSVVGFTGLLVDDATLTLKDKQRRNLERVAATSRELADFVNKILDYSKMEAGRMSVYAEAVDVRETIARAVHIAESLQTTGSTTLITEIASDLPIARTDRAKLQQILLNLLSNAVKFTPAGKIEVIASLSNAGQISLLVRDTGIGIAEAEIGKIFTDFYQANRRSAKPGSGLGLAITRRLVALLGGEISVSSRAGEGSVFSVTLPMAIESRDAATLETPPSDPERTALVIGADAATLYLTRKYLAEAGYSVATTDNLSHGMGLLRLAKPSLIALDLDAIDNHADTINQLATHKDESRLLVLSANPNRQRAAINSGADGFLPKPLERAVLLAMVSDASAPTESFVLVVDDDPDALEIMATVLETSGYRVETATNGREAMAAISRARPTLLILDLMMPEMDGFEVEHRLHLNPLWRDIPVLLLTARDLTNEERAALEDKAARIMQKGNFSREDLLNEVAAAIK